MYDDLKIVRTISQLFVVLNYILHLRFICILLLRFQVYNFLVKKNYIKNYETQILIV